MKVKYLHLFCPKASSDLADNVPHLLGVDDVGCVDDGGEAGPVQLRRVLVLILLSNRGSQEEHTHSGKRLFLFNYCMCKESEGSRPDLTEDVGGIPGPHEVWGVGSQRQHAFALDLLLQGLLVLPLQTHTRTYTRTDTHTHTYTQTHSIGQGGGMLSNKGVLVIRNVEGCKTGKKIKRERKIRFSLGGHRHTDTQGCVRLHSELEGKHSSYS